MMKADFVTIYGRDTDMSDKWIEVAEDIIRDKVPDYYYDNQIVTSTRRGWTCQYNDVKFNPLGLFGWLN